MERPKRQCNRKTESLVKKELETQREVMMKTQRGWIHKIEETKRL